jgi:hypothetical protein
MVHQKLCVGAVQRFLNIHIPLVKSVRDLTNSSALQSS